jgi:8-oxo-dGTP pyrophosphatase MutT (NUDIX family)
MHNTYTSPQDRRFLADLLSRARSPYPSGWREWSLEGLAQPLGVLSSQHAELLRQILPSHAPMIEKGGQWVWQAAEMESRERSDLLQYCAHQLHRQGHLVGWRGELYDCWDKGQTVWPYPAQPLFRLERAAYRFLGLRSHASHIHGVTPDGRMWCGRRAMNKATDPGMLDNMAAGGLPAGEQPTLCALREIHEEAGLIREAPQLTPCGTLTTERAEREGWHSETIFVYWTTVRDTETPCNQDGEVSEYLCLTMDEVLDRMRRGEFTHDAACAIALYLLNQAPRC